ncbi:MAG: NAD(P)/FAD-dependent oxidoreductase [Hyphomicrobiales bacterium]|jgi:2-polyprenyl-6-methoxyphenol hydroxylase-like FAD-dependent oxidoreductase|nr:NAD(P)/FAD-dependent oxidoreductase [Hyphomicrobiales bacterium]
MQAEDPAADLIAPGAEASLDCDVLISGGGPVGLCLAYLLASKGVYVHVVEAEVAITRALRASTFHPPTLDMLDPLGITAPLLEQGLICPSWQIRMHPSGERAVFDMGVLAADTKHPYRLQCEQWKLSEALLVRLAALHQAQLSFGTSLVSFVQGRHGFAARVEHAGRVRTVRSRFLVGCDGARSAVRRGLDLPFEGQTYPETTLLVTTRFPFEDHLEGLSNVSYCWKEGGNFSLLKVPGRWRVSIYPREDLSIEEQLSDEMINQALQVIVAIDGPHAVLESRPYRVHQRIVPTYVKDRAVLAGDAAHLNSPAGGMGLNGGLHDAFALSEALTGILQRDRPLDDLARYDRQRRPIAAEQILAQADRNRSTMREKDPARRREMLARLQAVTADRESMRAHLLKSSMIEGLRLAAAID